jgi:hypothetical protein
MEKLYEFKRLSYYTLLNKDYCEVSEEDLLGEHKSDNQQIFGFITPAGTFRKEFEYLKTMNDEESFVKNYNNYCAHCIFRRVTVVVEKGEDKTSIKLFSYEKNRLAGSKFFKKNTSCHFITYNHKQNCLYEGVIRNYHLKKKSHKRISKNTWYKKPIYSFVQLANNSFRGMKLNNFVDIESLGKSVNEAVNIFLSTIPNIDIKYDYGLENIIYKRYLDGIGAKVPNNWNNFNRTYPQLTKKIFKKYKYKFVDAYMGLHGLFGDKIKRVLHTIESSNGIETFKFGLQLFGSDFILSQPDDVIKKIIESHGFVVAAENFANLSLMTLDGYSKNEIRNCFEIFKLAVIGEVNIYAFLDHLKYKDRLKNFEPVVWRSNNYDKFNEEHFEWSEKVGSLSSAEYKRLYDDNFKQYIETPIEDFYPVLLSSSKEYNVESFVQSNCVRTYSDKPSSIIISLRKGDIESKNRSTIEYKIVDEFETIKLNRVQSLGKFNAKLDETWSDVLTELDVRMQFSLDNNIFKLPEVEIKYGGKKYMSHLIFVENKREYQMDSGEIKKLPTVRRLVFDTNLPSQKIYNPTLNLLIDESF